MSACGNVAKCIFAMYLGFPFNFEKEVQRCCSKDATNLVPIMLKLKSSMKRSEEVEEIATCREDGTMSAVSIPLLECIFYAWWTPAVS